MVINPEFKALIPPLSQEEYAQLEENILQDGIREPISLWGDTIIDGHNRYAIAQKHGLVFSSAHYDFDTQNDAIFWIIKNQFGRRNISAYDRSLLALRLKPVIAEKAKENQRRTSGNRVCQISDKQGIDTKKELAKMAGISHDTIAKVEKIEAVAAPEIKEKVKSGDMSIHQAYQEVKRQEKRAAIVEKFVDAPRVNAGSDIYTTENKYNIIYADPPWRYWESGNKNQANHYPTMTFEDICKLPIRRIADDNAILFIWVTYPILRDAFYVIDAWGFKYSTCGFCWVKENKNIESPFIGCGSWTRANSELCLIATRGNVTRLDASISQVIQSPVMAHSRKPDDVYEKIECLVGRLPRIELFARQSFNGWDHWGNET